MKGVKIMKRGIGEGVKRRRFHWWYIPLGILALLIILILVLLGLIRSMLPWQNVVAATSNGQVNLSEKMRAFALSGERDYSTLPEILTMEDVTQVTTSEQFEERRQEILQLFEENVYGTYPKEGYETSFEVVEEGEAMDGAAIRKQIKITVITENGSSDALMLLYLPKSDTPVPVVIGLNSEGNHCIYDDPAILPAYTNEDDADMIEEDRGSRSSRWCVETLISRGYGLATIYFEDIAPDNKETYDSRLISLFDDEDFKAISAWAFGISRGVDYLVTDPAVDATKIADIGHSRLGKAAVWAGANDERIALVISNDSGNSGASLSRGNHGETVKSINAIFPYWFSENYAAYGNNENELPVDQHELLACIAPRKLYVASAWGDLWSDPDGAWNSLMFAREAFELYGLETIPGEVLAEGETQDGPDLRLFSESVAYHVRNGWHEMQLEDWENYLDYMDEYMK